MDRKQDLDPLDYKILEILVSDANLPFTEIGNRLEVSGGTVHVRMKKMQALGIVKGSQLLIEDVAKQLEEIPEVVNIHYTTGIYSIFAKIICRDTQHLREVLHDKIQKVNGIQRTETFISLEESLIRNTPLF